MKAILTVLGQDKVGIIAAVSRVLADRQVNILDISQTILTDTFSMVMVVDASRCSVPFGALQDTVEALGGELGLSIRLQHADIFDAMHKV